MVEGNYFRTALALREDGITHSQSRCSQYKSARSSLSKSRIACAASFCCSGVASPFSKAAIIFSSSGLIEYILALGLMPG